jgi:hypothetical protein
MTLLRKVTSLAQGGRGSLSRPRPYSVVAEEGLEPPTRGL